MAKDLISFNLAGYLGPAVPNGGRPSFIVEYKNSENFITGIDHGTTYIH